MASRVDARARLDGLRHRLPYVSQSALAAIVKVFRHEDLLSLPSSRADIRLARDEVTRAQTPYGTLHKVIQLPLPCGGKLDLEYQAPLPMLHVAARKPGFARFLLERLRAKSPGRDSPWRLIVYSDEVSPGNQLSHDNRRKLQCIYWSFFEFGPDALQHENAWFVLTAVRSQAIKALDGGMSHLVGALLQDVFFDDSAHDISVAGCHVVFVDSQRGSIYANFGMKVADEAALKAVLLCKGASGSKPCFQCLDCVDDDLAPQAAARNLVPMTCVDINAFKPQTDKRIHIALQRLRDSKPLLSQAAFKALQQALGWNHSQYLFLRMGTLSKLSCP
jgi:hypothetical protein